MSESDQPKESTPAAPEVTGAAEKSKSTQDSFNVPVKKSPLLVYALLQIPLVLFMVILLYVMYQSRQN